MHQRREERQRSLPGIPAQPDIEEQVSDTG